MAKDPTEYILDLSDSDQNCVQKTQHQTYIWFGNLKDDVIPTFCIWNIKWKIS